MANEDVIDLKINNLEKRVDKMDESLAGIRKSLEKIKINQARYGVAIGFIQIVGLYYLKISIGG